MARSKEEITAMIRNRLAKKHIESFSFDDLLQIMMNASVLQKERFINAVKANDGNIVVNMLSTALRNEAQSRASSEADSMLLDDMLSIQDIDKIL